MKRGTPFKRLHVVAQPRSAPKSDARRRPPEAGKFANFTERAVAPEGKRNGMYRHGQFTKEALEERVLLRAFLERSREALLTLST